MKIKYDKEVDALYIELNKSKAQKTVKKSGDVLIDYDKSGNVLGIEVLHYSKANSNKHSLEILAGNKRISIPA